MTVLRRTYREQVVHGEQYDPTTDREALPKVKLDVNVKAKLMDMAKRSCSMYCLDEKRLLKVLEFFTRRKVPAGLIIYRQGESSNYFYMIESGVFKSYVSEEEDNPNAPDECLGTHEHSFGDNALFYPQAYESTVKAETDGVLWQIHRKTYTRVAVKESWETRVLHMKFLRSVDVFEMLESYEIVRLCDCMHREEVVQGRKIIVKGADSNGIYFIERGAVRVIRSGCEPEILRKGDYFGEMALITTEKRKMTVIAEEYCELFFVSSESVERITGTLYDIFNRRNAAKLKGLLQMKLGTQDIDMNIIRRRRQ